MIAVVRCGALSRAAGNARAGDGLIAVARCGALSRAAGNARAGDGVIAVVGCDALSRAAGNARAGDGVIAVVGCGALSRAAGNAHAGGGVIAVVRCGALSRAAGNAREMRMRRAVLVGETYGSEQGDAQLFDGLRLFVLNAVHCLGSARDAWHALTRRRRRTEFGRGAPSFAGIALRLLPGLAFSHNDILPWSVCAFSRKRTPMFHREAALPAWTVRRP